MIERHDKVHPRLSSSTEDELVGLLRHGLDNLAAVALWRLPNVSDKQLLLDLKKGKSIDTLEIEDTEGFVFSPYDCQGTSKMMLLNPDVYFSSHQGMLRSGDDIIPSSSDKLSGLPMDSIPSDYFPNKINTSVPDDSLDFVSMVTEGIAAIQNGTLEKVVLSRKKEVSLTKDFQLMELFSALCEAYEHAFVSLVAIPNVGIWIGASPEVLVKQNGNIFKTMALAGTKNGSDYDHLKDVSWKQKEIEEQAFVSRYIINCFKQIRLREFEEHGPKTVAAGNLVHLRTDFLVDIEAANFPQLASVMLDLLHPTSAVCGMPLDKAEEFILKHEKSERSYFSGFLGPVNLSGQTDIFVNLRCMEVNNGAATLYAGAGITESSDPEEELKETMLKYKTLLNIIEQVMR